MNYNTKLVKNNAQNKKIAEIKHSLIVGIDVGSEKHYARAFLDDKTELSSKPFEFENNSYGFQAFKTWAESIQKEYNLTKIVPGMEPTGHYWIDLGIFLQDNGLRPVHVNPSHVKRSKELDDNNPSKNDRKDSKTIAGLVIDGRYMYPYIPKDNYAELRALSNIRLQTQEELTRIKNRIAKWISVYFPEYKEVYNDIYAMGGMLVLKEAPLPADILKLGTNGITKIWRDVKLRASGIKRAQKIIDAAGNSIGNSRCPEAARLEIRCLINDYETYSGRLNELMAKIDSLVKKEDNVQNLLEIPGVSVKTASIVLAEIGDIHRFSSARQIQKLAGLAIVDYNQSGKHNGEHCISYRGRKRLRYALYEAALTVVRFDEGFRQIYDYYRNRTENPLKKMQALIAISCKLIRVFYAILTKGEKYDRDKLLKDIKRTTPAAA